MAATKTLNIIVPHIIHKLHNARNENFSHVLFLNGDDNTLSSMF